MFRYQSSHKKKSRLLHKLQSYMKLQHFSLHARNNVHTTQRQSTHTLTTQNLPVIKAKNRVIPIYLLYKSEKFVVKAEKGMTYKDLVSLLYKQIAIHQWKKNSNLTKQKLSKIIRNVVGFSTVCNNTKIDYLLSVLAGSVQKSLLLECFVKKIGKEHRKQTFKDKIQPNSPQIPNSKFSTQPNSSFKFNYEIYNCLAIGGFSKVYLARSYENGRFYVIKFIKKLKQKQILNRSSVLNQMEISFRLDHPFIIKMLEGFQTPKFFCMVFEYCPGGELFYLLKRVKSMSQESARFYFIQILLGIKHIHEQNILYRDLKPENILIDNQGNLKIVDFGLSKFVDSVREKTYSYCGSAQYMAPQMILRSGHNTSIDYYSLGALLYQLVTGLPPFYSKSQIQLQKSIVGEQLSFPSHIPLSMQIKDFLVHLLSKDQRYRLGSYAGIKEIMFHPWIGKFKQQEYLSKNKKNIPYPPDLSQHNFDLDQLGDDEEEFTSQVHKEFSCKALTNDIKVYCKSEVCQKDHIYNDIIETIALEVSSESKQGWKSFGQTTRKQNTSSEANMRKRKRRNNHGNIDFCSQKENRYEADSQLLNLNEIKQGLKSRQQCESISKINRQRQNLLKSYRKLFPYFSKNKICKVQKQRPIPKGSILKLKVMENKIQEQKIQVNF